MANFRAELTVEASGVRSDLLMAKFLRFRLMGHGATDPKSSTLSDQREYSSG